MPAFSTRFWRDFFRLVKELSPSRAPYNFLESSWFIIPFSLKATQKYGKNLIIKKFLWLFFYLKFVTFS